MCFVICLSCTEFCCNANKGILILNIYFHQELHSSWRPPAGLSSGLCGAKFKDENDSWCSLNHCFTNRGWWTLTFSSWILIYNQTDLFFVSETDFNILFYSGKALLGGLCVQILFSVDCMLHLHCWGCSETWLPLQSSSLHPHCLLHGLLHQRLSLDQSGRRWWTPAGVLAFSSSFEC